MASKRPKRPLIHSTELSEHVTMAGNLLAEGSLLIKGKYTGTIESSSHVTIDRGAVVESCGIAARSLTIAGAFSGAAKAAESVEILDGAKVRADVEAPGIFISEAARFEGGVRMPGIGD